MSPIRVVSLVPSITETLRFWGVDPVACTRFCEQPDLTTVGGTKNPDIAAIVALGPDVVMVDTEENRREDAEALAARGIEVFVTEVRRLADVGPTLERMARRVGVDWEVPASLLDAGPVESTRTAFVPIWRRPWMTIGADTFGSSLLAAIGVHNVFADPGGDPYPETTLGEAAARLPDLVLVPSEPYDFTDEHHDELSVVAPVVAVDGQDLFWWGARTPAAIERLRERIGRPSGGP